MKYLTISVILSGIILMMPACSTQTDLDIPQTSNGTTSAVASSEVSPEPDQTESICLTDNTSADNAVTAKGGVFCVPIEE